MAGSGRRRSGPTGSDVARRRKALGDLGEDIVAQWYVTRGFSVLARKWRSASGEIDVVARLGRLVVLCEVKTRSSDRFGAPVEAVTTAKVRRLRRLAGAFLSEARTSGLLSRDSGPQGAAGSSDPEGVDVRFDVASVTITPGANGRTEVEVIEGAF